MIKTREELAALVALRHISLEFHQLHTNPPYTLQTFDRCEHNLCIEARAALAASREKGDGK